ncbi:MAG: segregation/condensation protein A [Planctomycetes bacterium]|nr:segregation/condensation protein A [Planctomycetota bacterium]
MGVAGFFADVVDDRIVAAQLSYRGTHYTTTDARHSRLGHLEFSCGESSVSVQTRRVGQPPLHLRSGRRAALPQPEEDEGPVVDDDEPPGDLIQRLLEYKKFKEASLALEERAAEWQERYPRLSDDRPRGGKDPAADRIKDVELWDLVSALGRVLKSKEVDGQTRIQYDDTPISVIIERMSRRVRAEGRTPFSSFFEGTNDRRRIAGIFLALLELLRHDGFRAEQPVEFGEIWILPPREEPATDQDAEKKTPAPVDGNA